MSTESSHQLSVQSHHGNEPTRLGLVEYSGAALVAIPILLVISSAGYFATTAVRLRSQLQATWTQFLLLEDPALREGVTYGFEAYLWPPTRALEIFESSPAWLVLVAAALVCVYFSMNRSIASDASSDRRRSWFAASAVAPFLTALAVAPLPLNQAWLALWQQGLSNPVALGSALVLSFSLVTIGALLSLLCLGWLRLGGDRSRIWA
ncbi:MAG: hypothetical protein AAF725_25085 [Acidobacteriota bacterium]